VEAVGEVEGESGADDDDEDDVGARRPSRVLDRRCPRVIWAAVLGRVDRVSSTANMSFQRITTIGSIPLENSEATASREIRSPSFSSRWISIQ
jgi:hypothetical protein